MNEAWLVVIDAQHVFASPEISDWGSPFFPDALARIQAVAPRFDDRVVLTRWVPTAKRSGSWEAYYRAWPFADRDPADPLFDLVPEAKDLSSRPVVDLPTFGKWSPALRRATGDASHLVLAGVSTDCCVISTALPAADDGRFVTVLTDACAGSTAQNNAAALHVMGLYEPQITLTSTQALTPA